jgi:hypothetical protein
MGSVNPLPLTKPLAIVGFAFLMPGNAVDEASLWEILKQRRNLMTKWPENRSVIDSLYDPDTRKPNTVCYSCLIFQSAIKDHTTNTLRNSLGLEELTLSMVIPQLSMLPSFP